MHMEEYRTELIFKGYCFYLEVIFPLMNKCVVYVLQLFFHWLQNYIVLTLPSNFLHSTVLGKPENYLLPSNGPELLSYYVCFAFSLSYLYFILPVMSRKE